MADKGGYYPYGEPNIKANPTAEDWAETQSDIDKVFAEAGRADDAPVAQDVTKQLTPDLAIAGIPGLVGGGGLLGLLGQLGGIAAGAYGLWEAIGGGEGEGLFGLDLLGGDTKGGTTQMETGSYVDSIPLSGPGLAEPPAAWIEKEWTITAGGTKCQYYLVRMPTGGKRIAMYNFNTKSWKSWRVRKSSNVAYIGKKLPSHRMLTRLRRNLGKHSSDARTILKITSPSSLATSRRRRRR